MVLVTGERRSGKSTFCQHLINSILSLKKMGSAGLEPVHANGVLFLDLDPQIPLLAVPGVLYLAQVSKPLLSLSFASFAVGNTINRIVKAHCVGLGGVAKAPFNYLDVVQDLLSAIPVLTDCPIIINVLPDISRNQMCEQGFRHLNLTKIVHLGDSHPCWLSHSTPEPLLTILKPAESLPIYTRANRMFMAMQSYISLTDAAPGHPGGPVRGQLMWEDRHLNNVNKVDNYLEVTHSLHAVILSGLPIYSERVRVRGSFQNSIAYILKIGPTSALYSLVPCNQPDTSGKWGLRIIPAKRGFSHVVTESMAPCFVLEGVETLGACFFRYSALSEGRARVWIASPINDEISTLAHSGHRIALLFAPKRAMWGKLMSYLEAGHSIMPEDLIFRSENSHLTGEWYEERDWNRPCDDDCQ